MKHKTGVRRLDDLLGGGIPDRATVLVHGPPFVGKETFARNFVLEGLRLGVPAIYITSDATAVEVHDRFRALDPTFDSHVREGRIRFIDAYSASIGASVQHPATDVVDGLLNFNAVTAAVNSAQRALIRHHPSHRLVFDSVSTLIAFTNAQTAFRFLQVLVGRARTAGGTTLLLLGRGMHTEEEVQTVKHLTSGVIEFKAEGAKHMLRVEGVAGDGKSSNWIDYKFDDHGIEITGSFSGGRIT